MTRGLATSLDATCSSPKPSVVPRGSYESFPAVVAEGGLALQTANFIQTFLEPQLEILMTDDFGQFLQTRPIQLVLFKHRPRVSVIFAAYAALGDRGGNKKAVIEARKAADFAKRPTSLAHVVVGGEQRGASAGTDGGHGGDEAAGGGDPTAGVVMNMDEWNTMLREGKMIDGLFTQVRARVPPTSHTPPSRTHPPLRPTAKSM